MTTMCKDFRNDFLLWNKSIQRMEYCKDTNFIKYFWCRKDIPVDYEFLLAKRKAYYDINRWIYKPNYSICRDYRNPGRVDDTVCSSEDVVERAYNEWKLFVGNPVIESGPKRVPKPITKMEITLPTKTTKPLLSQKGIAKLTASKFLKPVAKETRLNLKRSNKEQDNFGFNISLPHNYFTLCFRNTIVLILYKLVLFYILIFYVFIDTNIYNVYNTFLFLLQMSPPCKFTDMKIFHERLSTYKSDWRSSKVADLSGFTRI